MGNACGPSHLSSRTYNGQYGPFSGWYAVTRDGDSHLSCATCSTYCFWSNRTAEDPGGDPHQGTVSTFSGSNPYNHWACVLGGPDKGATGGGDGLWFPSDWPRDSVHLRCNAGRDAPVTDAFYRMSSSPVFFAVLFLAASLFCARVVYVFLQRRRRRKVHCCAAAPPQASERCLSGCCYYPAAPQWSAGDDERGVVGDGAGAGIQLRQSLLYDDFDDVARDAIDDVDVEYIHAKGEHAVEPSLQQLRQPADEQDHEAIIANAHARPRSCPRIARNHLARTLQRSCFRPLRRCWAHRYCSPCRRASNIVRRVFVRWWDPVLEPTCLSLGFLWGLFFVLVACISFPESFGVQIPEYLYALTPQCSGVEAHTRCPPGQESFNRYGRSGDGGDSNKASSSSSSSFTLLIASDVQYNWYDGEAFDLLSQPTACAGRTGALFHLCETKDIAVRVQQQQMRAFAALVGSDRRAAMLDDDPTGWQWKRPDTVLLNGDLTAYFHPWQQELFLNGYRDSAANATIASEVDANALPAAFRHLYPSLGNHDFAQGKATFGGDEWQSTGAAGGHCNSKHAVEFFRGIAGGCDDTLAPRFSSKKIRSYHAPSMSYSWDRGRYHFVNLQYFPSFESKRINVSSSLGWLADDLSAAFTQRDLVTVINVHSADQLTVAFDRAIAGRGVVAIFAGHLHRCLGHRCTTPNPIDVGPAHFRQHLARGVAADAAEKDPYAWYADPSAVAAALTEDDLARCYSEFRDDGSLFPCSKGPAELPARQKTGYTGDQSFVEVGSDFDTKFNASFRERVRAGKNVSAGWMGGLKGGDAICSYAGVRDPFRRTGFWLNKTKGWRWRENETVPVFWSGSLSFQTFLRVGFNFTHMKVEAMTSGGLDGDDVVARYVDTREFRERRNRSEGWGFYGEVNRSNISDRNASWWARRQPNRKYPWHNYSDFMPGIRNVTSPEHEVGPWEQWRMYFPPNVTNGTRHASNATNATLIPRNSSWWNGGNRTFPSFNGSSNASSHAGLGYGGPCRAWFGFRCTEEGGCGV